MYYSPQYFSQYGDMYTIVDTQPLAEGRAFQLHVFIDDPHLPLHLKDSKLIKHLK